MSVVIPFTVHAGLSAHPLLVAGIGVTQKLRAPGYRADVAPSLQIHARLFRNYTYRSLLTLGRLL